MTEYSAASTATAEITPLDAPARWLDRNFTRLLVAIAAAGLIPALLYGKYQFVDFDGWWHLFTAAQDRWLILLGEWKYEAHPPLYYLLLRMVSYFGHQPLVLRSIGIISGCLSIYVIGVIAAKIYRYKSSALLVAAAYAFAMPMIELRCAVRAYDLALLFDLLAFNAFIDWMARPDGSRAGSAVMRFGLYSVLALLSEYYVVFFIVGCVGILILQVLRRPDLRAALLPSLRAQWAQWLFSSASIAAVLFGAAFFHLQFSAGHQRYLEPFFWSDTYPLGLGGFLLSNLANELSFFAPFGLDADVMLAGAAFLFVPALIYFTFARKKRWRGPSSSDAPLLVVMIVAQLLVLSLAGKYPFGGEFRHQSIIAPFIFLTVFLLLDRIGDALQPSSMRNALFGTVGLAIAASFAYGWKVYPWSNVKLLSAEYARFHTMFPLPETIYGDATSLIFYYSQTHQAKWTFQDRLLIDEQRIAVYQVDDGSGHPTRVLRNKREVNLDLTKPETYQTLADTLRQENLKSALLFFEGLAWTPESIKILEDRFKTVASLAGLDYGRYSIGTNYAFIEFKLR